MKYIITLGIILFMFIQSLACEHNIIDSTFVMDKNIICDVHSLSESTFNKMDYSKAKIKEHPDFKKFRIIRLCGYGALGFGIPTTLIGLFTRTTVFNQLGNRNSGNVIIGIGGGLTIIGIPMIIIANNIKWQIFRSVEIDSTYINIYESQSYALSFKLNF